MKLDSRISRRDALRTFGLMTTGLALTACTPLRIVAGIYPADFKQHRDQVTRVLRAFMSTVIPGAPDSSDLVRVLSDRQYPFARYAAFFASDLCRRAGGACANERFWELEPQQRVRVINAGLAADATTRKLYGGAIFLAQLAFYGGIYDDDAGCPLIDFAGRYRGDPISYDGAARFLPATLTQSGNYN